MHVERLNSASCANQAPVEKTAEWLAGVSEQIHSKLVAMGLCPPRETATPAKATTLGTMIDTYIARRTDLKPSTKVALEQARTFLVRHFGERCDVITINAATAKDWRRRLAAGELNDGKKLGRVPASGYVAKLVAKAKTFFVDAVEREILPRDPFASVEGAAEANPDRVRYIDRPTIDAVIAQATDPEWRALIALARYAGLRVPSEPLAMTWADVDFCLGRLTIRSAKTAHHDGKGIRIVPLMPEVEQYLSKLYSDAEPGQVYVFTKLRRPNINLRTQLERLITRAGVAPWPRLFHNLRGSCATDFAAHHPAHVAAAWLGHSVAIARAHYLKVTDADFDAARNRAKQALRSASDKNGQAGTLAESAREKSSVNAVMAAIPELSKWPIQAHEQERISGLFQAQRFGAHQNAHQSSSSAFDLIRPTHG